MLGDDGQAEPDADPERWRRQMAQATTALVSGWISEKILAIFRLNNTDNAHVIWGRLQQHYSNVTDIRSFTSETGLSDLNRDQSLLWTGWWL